MTRAPREGSLPDFMIESMTKTKRYTGLIKYIDTLYAIKDSYVTPRFKGDDVEDIIRIENIFNLLQGTHFLIAPERAMMFDEALLVYQERHSLAVDREIDPQTRRTLQESIRSLILKVKNLAWERLTQPKGPRYVRINIPEFKMYYYDEG